MALYGYYRLLCEGMCSSTGIDVQLAFGKQTELSWGEREAEREWRKEESVDRFQGGREDEIGIERWGWVPATAIQFWCGKRER